MTALHIKAGPLAGQLVNLSDDLTIGRENADLTIADGDLSRRHAVVRRTADGLEIEDLGSKNGTFVDGRRIAGPTIVVEGARLELGATILEVMAASGVTDGAAIAAPAAVATTESVVPAAAAAPVATGPAAPLVPLAAASTTPVGVFHPPSRRRGQLATRSLVPVVLSFGSTLLTAAALVVYFAVR